MRRRPPRSTLDRSSAASDVYKRQGYRLGDVADFSLGITPYDKYRGHSSEVIESKAFHSQYKVNETYKPLISCLLYTSPSPRDRTRSRMPSSA